ncbi:hypothetical protein FRC05_009441 [Tulasnella sp. 425]|nr:hypothetical protein FRC05_009441 [Tulasnella sp. 425]
MKEERYSAHIRRSARSDPSGYRGGFKLGTKGREWRSSRNGEFVLPRSNLPKAPAGSMEGMRQYQKPFCLTKAAKKIGGEGLTTRGKFGGYAVNRPNPTTIFEAARMTGETPKGSLKRKKKMTSRSIVLIVTIFGMDRSVAVDFSALLELALS